MRYVETNIKQRALDSTKIKITASLLPNAEILKKFDNHKRKDMFHSLKK